MWRAVPGDAIPAGVCYIPDMFNPVALALLLAAQHHHHPHQGGTATQPTRTQPVAPNVNTNPTFTSGVPTFTSGVPTFTSGVPTFTTGGAPLQTAPTVLQPMPAGGVWMLGTPGTTFVAARPAPRPPPAEERAAYVDSLEQRLDRLAARADVLRERAFAHNGDDGADLRQRRDVLAAGITASRASLSSARATAPESYWSMKKQWDATLAALEEEAGALDAVLP